MTEKQFMDGKVANVHYVTDISKKELLRGRIMDLCRATRDGFPGLQPVSLRRDNIHLIAQHRYRVSWKADGMRFLSSFYTFIVVQISCLHYRRRRGLCF